MKKYKFKAPNRTFQLLLPFLCAADNFAIVFLLCRLGLGLLGRIGLADFLLQDPVLDYITKAVLILSVVYSLLPLVMPKGCFLYDDQVVLARYTITALNWKNKIAVPYYMIENAYVQYSSIYWTKDMFSELVPYGDFNYNGAATARWQEIHFFSPRRRGLLCGNYGKGGAVCKQVIEQGTVPCFNGHLWGYDEKKS